MRRGNHDRPGRVGLDFRARHQNASAESRVGTADYIHLRMPADGAHLARRFYVKLLGLEEIPTPANPASHRGVWFRGGGLRLHLGAAPEWPSKPAVPIVPVDDLRRAIDALLTAGYQAKLDLDTLPGFLRAIALDPFGNRIELIQTMLPQAPR